MNSSILVSKTLVVEDNTLNFFLAGPAVGTLSFRYCFLLYRARCLSFIGESELIGLIIVDAAAPNPIDPSNLSTVSVILFAGGPKWRFAQQNH